MVQDRSPPRPIPDAADLRLHALDHEDLALVSAILQDALIRVGDLAYLPGQRRFALVGARFDWAAEAEGRLERCKAGLHFEGVQRVRLLRVAHDQPETVLELLAVTFEPGPEAPSGVVKLVFAGGGAMGVAARIEMALGAGGVGRAAIALLMYVNAVRPRL